MPGRREGRVWSARRPNFHVAAPYRQPHFVGKVTRELHHLRNDALPISLLAVDASQLRGHLGESGSLALRERVDAPEHVTFQQPEKRLASVAWLIEHSMDYLFGGAPAGIAHREQPSFPAGVKEDIQKHGTERAFRSRGSSCIWGPS